MVRTSRSSTSAHRPLAFWLTPMAALLLLLLCDLMPRIAKLDGVSARAAALEHHEEIQQQHHHEHKQQMEQSKQHNHHDGWEERARRAKNSSQNAHLVYTIKPLRLIMTLIFMSVGQACKKKDLYRDSLFIIEEL